MSVTDTRRRAGHGPRQPGAFLVEFALVLILFLVFMFGILELLRILFLFNAVQDVTRRAATLAANTNYQDATAMSVLRQQAIYRTTPGGLLLGAPVTDASIRIDYLSLTDLGTTVALTPIPTPALPSCPANNRLHCMKDRYAASCIQLVRARVCDPGDTENCNRVQLESLLPLVNFAISLPTAPTIVPADTLGALPGQVPCP